MPATLRRSRIVDADGNPFLVPRRTVRASYDAAQTTSENVRHWAQTDSLSADAANSATVRSTLRKRARYEAANNGWARSMVATLAHETIGAGPRIQINSGNRAADEYVERAFASWAKRVRLARKLRTMRTAKAIDGEAVALFVNNPRLGDVQLDLRPIEAEMLSTPSIGLAQENAIDGIDLDDNGEPIRYHVLKHHPGGTEWGIDPNAEVTPAPDPREVIHIFRCDRPGQHRGIPEITPALPLFAKLRRYTLAVLAAAENAAEISLALETQQPDSAETDFGPSGTSTSEPSSYEAFDTLDFERGLITVLPEGTKLFQPSPTQPSTTHSEFVRITLAEAFAAVCLPYAMGAQDSSGENFASGKLTRLGFKHAVEIERSVDWIPEVERIFWEWYREARFAFPLEVQEAIAAAIAAFRLTVSVFFDGIEPLDPAKDATATETLLAIGVESLPDVCARRGRDWEEVQTRAAKALGLSVAEYRKRLAAKLLGPSPGSPAAPPAKPAESKPEPQTQEAT